MSTFLLFLSTSLSGHCAFPWGWPFTAPFNNMRTLKPNLYRQMRFSIPSIKCSAALPSFRPLPSVYNQIFERSSDNETVNGSCRKLGGAVEYLIDVSEKLICRSSFEFWSPLVPELSFLPTPYSGWTRAGERGVQDNLHAHAQNEPIKNRSPSLGACNSHNKPMPRHFYRPVYF